MSNNFKIGFVGGGNMSTAIVQGILKNDAYPASNIWVSGPHLENLQKWSLLNTNVSIKNSDVFNNCEIIFLGIKPNKLETAVQQCLNGIESLSKKKSILFVSMLAGRKINDLQEVLSVLSPYADIRIIRIMPNTPMAVGAGICLYTTDNNVSQDQCKFLEDLLSSTALCERVEEPTMDTLGVLTACGPAFIYIVIEALADGAVKQGVPRAMALRHAAQVVVGSGQMVLQTGKHPGLLKDEVCSPAGSTICGVTELENGRLRSTFINAIEAATNRTKDLGKR